MSDDATVAAFLVASRALVGVAARSLADVDITLPQFRALIVVAGDGGITVSQLAERLDVHRSTTTRLCDRLVRKQLIRRTERSADRREVEIVLTAKGRRLIDRVLRRRWRDLAEITDKMSPRERQQAIAGLTAFARAAGETPEELLFGWPQPATPSGAA